MAYYYRAFNDDRDIGCLPSELRLAIADCLLVLSLQDRRALIHLSKHAVHVDHWNMQVHRPSTVLKPRYNHESMITMM